MSAYDCFITELLGDRDMAPCAVKIRHAFDALDVEGDGNLDATVLYEAVCWIANQRGHPLRERVDKITELTGLRGKVHISSLRRFCGW
jgi:hypothetical protein